MSCKEVETIKVYDINGSWSFVADPGLSYKEFSFFIFVGNKFGGDVFFKNNTKRIVNYYPVGGYLEQSTTYYCDRYSIENGEITFEATFYGGSMSHICWTYYYVGRFLDENTLSGDLFYTYYHQLDTKKQRGTWIATRVSGDQRNDAGDKR